MGEADRKPLHVGVERHENCAVVKLSGAAEMADWAQLRHELEALAMEQQPLIVLDLSELEFLGSEGLSAVVYGHLKNRHHGGKIRLACPQPLVLDVVRRSRLTQLFPAYDSVAQAVEA